MILIFSQSRTNLARICIFFLNLGSLKGAPSRQKKHIAQINHHNIGGYYGRLFYARSKKKHTNTEQKTSSCIRIAVTSKPFELEFSDTTQMSDLSKRFLDITNFN